MSKALTETLEKIHAKLADDMLKLLESGEAEAKDWAVIVKFLKDNNIDAIPTGAGDASDALSNLIRKAQESSAKYQ